MMELYQVDNDINVFCVTASSFPNGVMAAHKQLHSLVNDSPEREYFGLSKPNEKGVIVYKAAARELTEGEAKLPGCESFVIEKGVYASIYIRNFCDDIQSIGNAFQQLISHPNLDPKAYCIECYIGEKDVRCMVKLLNS
jgi:hypothetical protein